MSPPKKTKILSSGDHQKEIEQTRRTKRPLGVRTQKGGRTQPHLRKRLGNTVLGVEWERDHYFADLLSMA